MDILVIKKALDAKLYVGGANGYLELYDDSDTIIGSSVSCNFTQADGNGTVNLVASKYFPVPSGTKLGKLLVYSSNSFVGEAFPSETFTTNGTYTVADIVTTLGD